MAFFARARRSRLLDLLLFAAIVLIILAILRILPAPDPVVVSGRARIIDGDSLVVQGMELRLKGIDAPEILQECVKEAAKWPCGRESARRLGNFLRGKVVTCDASERDAHDRLLARCKTGGRDINRWMVEQGWAVSFHDYSSVERAARAEKRGIWSSTFVRPQDWREENR